MRWERVQVVARARETTDGRRSGGRTGGVWGPGKRWGHSCNSVKGGRYIYVFGGYGGDTCQTNDVHVFDTVKQTWSKPMMKGVPPSPRDSHSCTTVGNRLFVFGGTDGTNPLNDLHILDASTNTWISPILHGKGPDAREGHSAALINKKLFIFGGCGKFGNSHEEVYYNDLYILDTETLVWERAVTSGTPPVPRDSHTCSSWKNKLIVLGGEDASDCYLADVHMLDADSLTWRQITTSGQMLAPRAGHTTVSLGSNLFVFGGFTDARNLYDDLHVLDVENGKWSRVTNINQGPSARFSVAGDCLDEQRGILVFLGGCNKSLEALDDMYYLYADMSVNNGLSQPSQEFLIAKELKRKYTHNYLEKCSGVPLASSELSQSMLLHEYGQAGSKTSSSCSDEEIAFEARITSANQYGYAIETIVNGKLLRGMLFSCTSCYGEDTNTCMGKRMRKEIGSKLDLNQSTPSPSTQGMRTDLDNLDGSDRNEASAQGSVRPDKDFAGLTTHFDVSSENTVSGKPETLHVQSEASGAESKLLVEDPCSTNKDAVKSEPSQVITNDSKESLLPAH
ncbi:Acyl-CoA-binding domain-containing protein 4 [Apostasia shenzhenica]|uniref:Acyl-CoA-binding domain-containing protein 4 n=1 Tax=Apostasia shenzhenica TaxID=1088818 RepID=A0A2I0AWC6_9ASPA|nr:Acyl-CoA-binding domain-containing protein 4 [Apostasia shenzhenica]